MVAKTGHGKLHTYRGGLMSKDDKGQNFEPKSYKNFPISQHLFDNIKKDPIAIWSMMRGVRVLRNPDHRMRPALKVTSCSSSHNGLINRCVDTIWD